jgi:ferritin-like metal-binding protein YciE
MATREITARVMKLSKLKELFVEQLQDVYWIEIKLVLLMRQLMEAVTSPQLVDAFSVHREETKEQVRRLEDIFEAIGEPVVASKCSAMEGIMEEADYIIYTTDDGSTQRDAGLIIAMQKAEHYQIATYSSVVQLAETLGYPEAKIALEFTLGEEKAADRKLAQIAKSGIYNLAALEDDNDAN